VLVAGEHRVGPPRRERPAQAHGGPVHSRAVGWVVQDDVDGRRACREPLPQPARLDVPFYAPYAGSVEKLHDIRRADTHEVVHIQHKTLAECLEFYFVHPEWKAANPDGTGPLTRRHVRVLRHVLCGKETSRVLDDEADETDGTLANFEEQVFGVGSLREALRQYSVRDLMAATGLPRQTLYDLMGGAEPAPPTLETIRAGLARLASTATLSYEDRRRERCEQRRAVAKG
jgi:hypothetical protein